MKRSPTPEPPVAPASWLGLRLPFEILVAPARAFSEIGSRPEWIPAFALVVLSGWAYIALAAPAMQHLKTILPPPDGLAGSSPADIASGFNEFLASLALNQILSAAFAIFLTAIVLFWVGRSKGATTPLTGYVSLAANSLVPTALGSLVAGVGTVLHPANSYGSFHALMTAVPDNLALFANPAVGSEALFLGQFDVFTIWSTIVLAYGFAAMVPVKLITALSIAFALTLLFAIII